MTRGRPVAPEIPLTHKQSTELDLYVLAACALDPEKDAGSIAADATLEDLIPGRLITHADILQSKKRLAIVRPAEPLLLKQPPEQKKGEPLMIRRSPGEKKDILGVIGSSATRNPKELMQIINSNPAIALSAPVKLSYVKYMLAKAPKKASKRAADELQRRSQSIPLIPAREASGKHGVAAGIKFDGTKLKYRLVFWGFIEAVVRVLMWGAKTYAPDNWKKVADRRERYKEAILRHSIAYAKGEIMDKDTQESHLACIGCNAMFLHWMDETGDEGK